MRSPAFFRSMLIAAAALSFAACSDNGQLLGQRASADGGGTTSDAGTGGSFAPSSGGRSNLGGGGRSGATSGGSGSGTAGAGAAGGGPVGAGGQPNACDPTRNDTPGVATSSPTDVGTGACDGVTLADVIAQIRGLRPDLDDVTLLFASGQFTDGSFIYAFQRPDGGFALAFKRGSGDCPAGCIQNDYWYFETGAGCKVEQVGETHPTHDGACIPVDQLPRWGVPPEAPGSTICDAATACSGTGGGSAGGGGGMSSGGTSSGGTSSGAGTSNGGSGDRGGTCNTGCTRGTTVGPCMSGELLWQCGNQALTQYIAQNCRDLATDLPRYCCPEQFLAICAPTI